MVAPVRIAVDFRPALLGRSGIPRVVRELCRALATDPSLDLRLFGHALARPVSSEGAPPGARLHRRRFPGRLLPLAAALGFDAARLAGNAALFHWTDYVFPPVRRGIPVVWTLHDAAFVVDPSWHGPDAARLAARAERAARRAARIVCPTRATATVATERLGIAPERLRVVPWGADHAIGGKPATSRPDGTTAGTGRHLLAVGTIEPRKNHARLLAAWRGLGAERPPLVVVGRPGWCCDDEVAMLERARIDEPLTWLPAADDATLARLYADALALVYPSLHEGFGLPAVEALVRGLPVVCGDDAALTEATLGGAFHVDARSVDAIRDGIVRALAGDAPARAAAAGRRLLAERPWRGTAAGYRDVYRECVG